MQQAACAVSLGLIRPGEVTSALLVAVAGGVRAAVIYRWC